MSNRKVRALHHPKIKNEKGTILADNPSAFAHKHNPEIRYEHMNNSIDALTACKSPDGEDYDFHYEVIKYAADGIYIRRVSGPGHHTYNEEMRRLVQQGLAQQC